MRLMNNNVAKKTIQNYEFKWSSSGSTVKKTNYFSKNYFTNFANYMISQLSDMARESSEFTYQIIMTPLLFAV